MKPWEVDVPVLLIFFVRDDVFRLTFEQVRLARPSVLLLWQDGPRKDKPSDLEGIERCRVIAENIDWECTVYRKYNTENIGCDPSIFYAYRWAFSHVNKCIFLEDDQVPNQGYFRFCKELLDRYENDTRISHICGYNYTEITEHCKDSYLFAPFGSGAWATWKRVADEWDETYSFVEDEAEWSSLRITSKILAERSYKTAVRHKGTGKAHWESLVGCNCLLNRHVAIIPQKNLVSNKGLTDNAAHSKANIWLLPKVTRKLFYMKTYEPQFPLKHPKHIFIDEVYTANVRRIMGLGHPWLVKFRRCESALYRIFSFIKKPKGAGR